MLSTTRAGASLAARMVRASGSALPTSFNNDGALFGVNLFLMTAFMCLASEATGFPHEVCEMALAHTIANKAEAAYRRGDLFDKRRKLMDAWASYCATTGSEKVVSLRGQAAA